MKLIRELIKKVTYLINLPKTVKEYKKTIDNNNNIIKEYKKDIKELYNIVRYSKTIEDIKNRSEKLMNKYERLSGWSGITIESHIGYHFSNENRDFMNKVREILTPNNNETTNTD